MNLRDGQLLELENEETMRRLERLCIKLCGTQPHAFPDPVEEARDLAMETMEAAIKNIEKFREDSKLSTWLYRIAINTFKNRLSQIRRRQAKAEIFSLDAPLNPRESPDDEVLPQLADTRPDPCDIVQGEESVKVIARKIAGLPNAWRIALEAYMTAERGSTEREIARGLDVSEATYKARLFKVRELLRERLARAEIPVPGKQHQGAICRNETQIRLWLADGANVREIARRLGASSNAVCTYIRRHIGGEK